MEDETWKERASRQKAALRPAEGFNLIMVDTFDPPGEATPMLVGHFATRAEAEAERAVLEAEDVRANGGFARFYVYDRDNY